MKLKQISLIFSLGLIIFFISSCSTKSEKQVEKIEVQPITVSVQDPVANTDNSISLTGQVESVQSANISTRVMGYITDIKVKTGDVVTKGQLLVTISSDDIRAKLAQADAMVASAQASFKSAEKDFQRFTNLYNQKSATAKELDNVNLQYQSAKAGVQAAMQVKSEANSMLAYTNITAPFSGVIAQKLSDAGSIANPGMPILVLEQNKNLQVSASIPESEIKFIKLKSPAIVSLKSLDKTFEGEVSEISPSSIATGGQFIIKINLPDEAKKSLSSGMYANVNIVAEGRAGSDKVDAVLIPKTAINNVGQLSAIYTLSNDNKALLRYVRTGKTYGDQVEILSGLSNDERFIVSAEGKLYNGVPVKIK